MSNLTLSVSPHIRSGITTRRIMLDVIIALCPALIAAIINFGWRCLLVTAVSCAACVATEYIFERLHKQEITVGDLSAVVTGMLIAFNVTATMPLWEVIIGDIAAIAIAKMLFGGIGRNFVNPALIGKIVMMFSFTAHSAGYTYPVNHVDALSSATPLSVIDKLTLADIDVLLLGNHGGMIGETCIIALLLGFAYLVIRKVIKPITTVAFVGSAFLFIFLFNGFDAEQALIGILSGGLMIGAVFMATDYTTTPTTNLGKLIFGLGCGFITAIIRVFGNYAEGVSFSILLMNLIVPYINISTRRPFGEVRAK